MSVRTIVERASKRNNVIISILLVMVLFASLVSGCLGSAKAKVNQKLELAVKYLSENKFQEAVLAYNAILTIDPKNLAAYKGLGKTYTIQGKYDQAEKVYQQALGKVEDKNQIKLCLAGLYIDENKTDKAEETYKQLIKANPQYIPAYEGLTKLLLSQEKIEEAINILLQCIAANRDNERGYSLLAEANMAAGNKEQALKALTKSLEINLNQQAAYDLMEKLYDRDWAQIIAYGTKIREANENIGRTLMIYGFYNSGAYNKAIAAYQAIIDQSPQTYKAAIYTALSYLKENNIKTAEKLIRKINLKKEKNPYLYADVARYYLEKGDLKKARQIALKGIEVDDTCLENYLVLYDISRKNKDANVNYYLVMLLSRSNDSVDLLEEALREQGTEFELTGETNDPNLKKTVLTTVKEYDLRDLEERLIRSGYVVTLSGAFWVAEQGNAIVPYLDILLSNVAKYRMQEGGATGAFPFNVIWALAQIGGDQAEKVLEKHMGAMYMDGCNLALKAIRVRKTNPRLKILISEKTLYKDASYASEQLGTVAEGEAIIVLQAKIVNPNEQGGRGGPATFDYIEIPGKHLKGYILRAGDDFPPFY